MRNILAAVVLTHLTLVLFATGYLLAEDSLFPNLSEVKDKKVGEIVLKSGTYDGKNANYGYVLVPENRSNPNSRLIPLPFVRILALQDNSSEAIFLMTGGPGGSNLWVDLPAVFYTHNDFVKVGYRGVDGEVKLKCPEIGKAMTIDDPLSPPSLQKIRQTLHDSYDRLTRDGIDLDGYNMVEVVDDLEAVRKALAYGKISLFSTSYGTQLAYIYCLRYPSSVHRNLMFGASNRSRTFGAGWEPEAIEKLLRDYNEMWRSDPEAAARTPDILATMKKVLATLPRYWKNIRIDADKLRIVTFYLLYETETAAAVFDAYVSAESGDYSGLAVLSVGYDEEFQNTAKSYKGDFFSKIVSGGLDTLRNYEEEMIPAGSVLGSPAGKLLWSAAAHGGWPIKQIPRQYCQLDTNGTETLIENGCMDFTTPAE